MVKLISVKALIAIALTKKWKIYQMDVHNVFLYGDLEQEIYMKPPDGDARVCKSFYALQQISRNWFAKYINQNLVHSI